MFGMEGDILMGWITTKNGNRYRIVSGKWRDLLLFPQYFSGVQGYMPTEKEILDFGDSEIIEIYEKIDHQNEERRSQL